MKQQTVVSGARLLGSSFGDPPLWVSAAASNRGVGNAIATPSTYGELDTWGGDRGSKGGKGDCVCSGSYCVSVPGTMLGTGATAVHKSAGPSPYSLLQGSEGKQIDCQKYFCLGRGCWGLGKGWAFLEALGVGY